MLVANEKTICLIGYEQSTVVQESRHFISKEFSGDVIDIRPEEFFNLEDKHQYQYVVAFTIDRALRKMVIEAIEHDNLDCPIFVHDSCVLYSDDISAIIGKGTFIAPHSTVCLDAKIGKYCVIETYCLISHYVNLQDNVIMHSGAMVAGRTSVGANCVFNFKSAAINALNICNDVEIGACGVITKNIELPGYYVGAPARKISTNQQ